MRLSDQRLEHDNTAIKTQVQDLHSAFDSLFNQKASGEKNSKALTIQLTNLYKRVSEVNLQVNDHKVNNRKATVKNNNLLQLVEVVNNNLSVLHKACHQLNQVKIFYKDESKERQSLLLQSQT